MKNRAPTCTAAWAARPACPMPRVARMRRPSGRAAQCTRATTFTPWRRCLLPLKEAATVADAVGGRGDDGVMPRRARHRGTLIRARRCGQTFRMNRCLMPMLMRSRCARAPVISASRRPCLRQWRRLAWATTGRAQTLWALMRLLRWSRRNWKTICLDRQSPHRQSAVLHPQDARPAAVEAMKALVVAVAVVARRLRTRARLLIPVPLLQTLHHPSQRPRWLRLPRRQHPARANRAVPANLPRLPIRLSAQQSAARP